MKRIAILYTGGTIGMVRNEAGVLLPSSGEILMRWLNGNMKDVGMDIKAYDPIDSSDVQPSLWATLEKDIREFYKCGEYCGFLVLHGTDTMAFTASALSFLLVDLEMPIILTGSQFPLSEPNSDAQLNLKGAITLLSQFNEKLPNEVFIFFDGYLYRGNRSTKVDCEGLHAFASPNYPHYLRYIENDKIEVSPDFKHFDKCKYIYGLDTLKLINIKVVFLLPGITNVDVDSTTCQVVILLSYGAGNAPTADNFLKQVQELTKRGICVLNLSQCQCKSNKPSSYQIGTELVKRGVINMGDITLEACYTKVYYVFNLGYWDGDIKRYLARSLAGEMTTEHPCRYLENDQRFAPAMSCLVLQNSRCFNMGLLSDILRKFRFSVEVLLVPENYSKLREISSSMIDLVIILGGVNTKYINCDGKIFSCYVAEIKFIKYRIDKNLPLLGIGFGAQLIAKLAGTDFSKICEEEMKVGFFPLEWTEEGKQWWSGLQMPPKKSKRKKAVTNEEKPLLKHALELCEKTFALPEGAILLAGTSTFFQAFRIDDWCLAFQFHPEITRTAFLSIAPELMSYYWSAENRDDAEALSKQETVDNDEAKIFLTFVIKYFHEKLHAQKSATHQNPPPFCGREAVEGQKKFGLFSEKERTASLNKFFHLELEKIGFSTEEMMGQKDDCFFNSCALAIAETLKIDCNAILLRQKCRKFARTMESDFPELTVGSVKGKEACKNWIYDAFKGNTASYKKYLESSDDSKDVILRENEVDMRIICKIFGIKIHMIKLCYGENLRQPYFSHEIIDCDEIKSTDAVTAAQLLNNANTIHLVSSGNGFTPILPIARKEFFGCGGT